MRNKSCKDKKNLSKKMVGGFLSFTGREEDDSDSEEEKTPLTLDCDYKDLYDENYDVKDKNAYFLRKRACKLLSVYANRLSYGEKISRLGGYDIDHLGEYFRISGMFKLLEKIKGHKSKRDFKFGEGTNFDIIVYLLYAVFFEKKRQDLVDQLYGKQTPNRGLTDDNLDFFRTVIEAGSNKALHDKLNNVKELSKKLKELKEQDRQLDEPSKR
jgi:hypothetical protein